MAEPRTTAEVAASLETVVLSVEDGVALVALNRPEQLNALGVAGKTELGTVWRALAADDDVRAVVLAGNGPRAFCAGSDMKEMARTGRTASTDVLLEAVPGIGVALDKPVVAALHGHVIGMGVTLTLHCDLRVAQPDARLSLPEVQHGALSAVTAVRLPTLVGHPRAAELMLEGRRLDADEALAWGVVNEVAEDARARALERAARLAALPAVAMQQSVRLMRHTAREDVRSARALIVEARTTAEAAPTFTAATTAFSERQ